MCDTCVLQVKLFDFRLFDCHIKLWRTRWCRFSFLFLADDMIGSGNVGLLCLRIAHVCAKVDIACRGGELFILCLSKPTTRGRADARNSHLSAGRGRGAAARRGRRQHPDHQQLRYARLLHLTMLRRDFGPCSMINTGWIQKPRWILKNGALASPTRGLGCQSRCNVAPEEVTWKTSSRQRDPVSASAGHTDMGCLTGRI